MTNSSTTIEAQRLTSRSPETALPPVTSHSPEPGEAQSRATVILCALAMIFEGFDTYAIGYVGPAITKEWSLSQALVGEMYAIGVAASLIGSIAFGFLSDRYGRKRLLLLAITLFGLASLLGAFAPSIAALMLSRVINGVGLGASIPCAMALAVEAAAPRFRTAIPVLLSAAIGSGQIVASQGAMWIMPSYGWRGMLLLGAVFPIFIVALMAFYLVETRPAAGAREARLPIPALMADGVGLIGLLTVGALFSTYFVTFFFGFWLPTLVQHVTPDIATVGLAMTFIKLGSLAGGLAVTWLVTVYGLKRTLPLSFVLAAAGVVLLVGLGSTLAQITLALGVASFFLDGAFSGVIGLGAAVFPARIRATGIGLTIGLGRLLGGTAGPMAGGLLLDRHVTLHTIGVVFAMPLLIAAACSWLALKLAARRDDTFVSAA